MTGTRRLLVELLDQATTRASPFATLSLTFLYPHRLDICKFADSVNPQLSAMTGPLDPAKGNAGIRSHHPVNENHPRVDVVYETFALSWVVGPSARSQSEAAGVGNLNCVIQVLSSEHTRHWAEELFAIGG